MVTPEEGGLRSVVMRGSAYMALRHGLATAIGVVGVVVLTRELGPGEYGRYVGALGIVLYVTTLTRFGVEIFLVRRPEAPDPHVYRTAFTLMLLGSCTVAAVGILAAPTVIGELIGEAFVAPFRALMLALPFSLLLAPGLAALERDLRYREVATVEILNSVVFYVVAIPWALAAPSFWAPVAAYLAAQAASFGTTSFFERRPLGLAWSSGEVRTMLRYGGPLTLVTAFTESRQLVNPLVVGGLLGPAAVGQVGLALRAADMLRFASKAGSRVSIAALSRVTESRERLSRSITDGMFLQILATAPLYALFALVSGWVIPPVLGEEWETTVKVFPLVAVGALAICVLSMQLSLLFVLARSHAVLPCSIASLLLLAAGAAAAIELSGSAVGYGVGEVASCAGLALVVIPAARHVDIGYATFLPWLAGSVPTFFFPWLGLPLGLLLYLPAIVVLSFRSERVRLGRYLRFIVPGARSAAST